MGMVGGTKPPPGQPFKTLNSEDYDPCRLETRDNCLIPWKVLRKADREGGKGTFIILKDLDNILT